RAPPARRPRRAKAATTLPGPQATSSETSSGRGRAAWTNTSSATWLWCMAEAANWAAWRVNWSAIATSCVDFAVLLIDIGSISKTDAKREPRPASVAAYRAGMTRRRLLGAVRVRSGLAGFSLLLGVRHASAGAG